MNYFYYKVEYLELTLLFIANMSSTNASKKSTKSTSSIQKSTNSTTSSASSFYDSDTDSDYDDDIDYENYTGSTKNRVVRNNGNHYRGPVGKVRMGKVGK
jgi:hypothetical protein